MGLLSGLLTAIAIVATVATGGALGIVAGALMAGSYAASQGWIGGSVGKFFKSGLGKGLVLAVGLASAASSIMNLTKAVATTTSVGGEMAAGNAALAAGNQTLGSVGQASAGSAIGAAGSGSAAGLGAGAGSAAAATADFAASPAGTVGGFMAQNVSGGSQFVQSLQASHPESLTSGLSAPGIGAENNALDLNFKTATGIDASKNLGTDSSGLGQASQATDATQASVNAAGSTNATTSATPTVGTTSSPSASQIAASNNFGADAATAPPPGGLAGVWDKTKGVLGKVEDFADKHSGLLTVGGKLLSGMAEGASNQELLKQKIAADQWGNLQWNDRNQVNNMQSAAANPIDVPVGYLNRAQAVRNLMNNSTSQTTPLTGPPGGGAAPPPIAAPRPTIAPLGMRGG